MFKTCVVCKANCNSTTFHKFPQNSERCKEWAELCRRSDIINEETGYCYGDFRIGSSHFEPSSFTKCNHLKRTARPTIFSWTEQPNHSNTIDRTNNVEPVIMSTWSCQATNTSKDIKLPKIETVWTYRLSDLTGDGCLHNSENIERRSFPIEIPKVKRPIKCCLRFCDSKWTDNNQHNLSYFSFPENPIICEEWIKNCGHDILPTVDCLVLHQEYKICSLHFTDNSFNNSNKTTIFSHALPTLFENIRCKSIFYNSKHRVDFSQTCSKARLSMVSNCDTRTMENSLIIETPSYLVPRTPPEIKKVSTEPDFMKQPQRTSIEIDKQNLIVECIDSCLRLLQQYISSEFYLVIKSRLYNELKKYKGHKYPNFIIQLSLILYFRGPEIFEMHLKQNLLPSPQILKQITINNELRPGLNNLVIQLLSFKTLSLNSVSLDCTLCADIIALKTSLFYNISKDRIFGFHDSNSEKKYGPAKYALLLMVKGLNSQWKQPLAYFLMSSISASVDLKPIIFATISLLHSIKLNVRALVTNQSLNFLNLSLLLNVSPVQPYFVVEDRLVFYIFDPPYLLKSTRNIFFKYNFLIDDKLIDKKYLRSFYIHEQKTCPNPLLTYAHLYPGPLENKKTNLAAQVFSPMVAVRMADAITSYNLPLSSQFTMFFIRDMAKLFGIFNSSTLTKNDDNYHKPFENSTIQAIHLKRMADIFIKLKIIDKCTGLDVTKRMKFINGWLTSMSALKMLWSSIHGNKEKGYVLYTNGLNMSCLDDVLNVIRQKQGNSFFNPTPFTFCKEFKRIFFDNYFQRVDKNCIESVIQVLYQLESVIDIEQDIYPISPPIYDGYNNDFMKITDYRHLKLPDKYALIYVSNYLLKKCLENHKCEVCISYVKYQHQVQTTYVLSSSKDISSCVFSRGGLTKNVGGFCAYIATLDKMFIEIFPSIAFEDSVKVILIRNFNNESFHHPCKKFNKLFLLNLYTRFKIFSTVSFLNKSLFLRKKLKDRQFLALKAL